MNSSTKTGWEIREISISQRNGGFFIVGANHESTDPLFQTFCWHVASIEDARYSAAPDIKVGAGVIKVLIRQNSRHVAAR